MSVVLLQNKCPNSGLLLFLTAVTLVQTHQHLLPGKHQWLLYWSFIFSLLPSSPFSMERPLCFPLGKKCFFFYCGNITHSIKFTILTYIFKCTFKERPIYSCCCTTSFGTSQSYKTEPLYLPVKHQLLIFPSFQPLTITILLYFLEVSGK